MEQVLMKSASDCGIPVEANALGVSYAFLAPHFALNDKHELSDLNDSMVHHKVLLWELDIPSRIVDIHDIWEGRAVLEHVCMLIHDQEHPTMAQHWVNVESINKDSGTITLLYNMEKCKRKTVTFDKLYSLYTDGMLNHAHEVYAGKVREPNWLERFYVWVTKGLF